MNDHPRHLTTEPEREWFHAARRRGGMCAACGRSLGDDETVYVEPCAIGPSDGPVTWAYGAVGAECAAPERVREAAGEEPERCAGCGRGMHYRVTEARRKRALCSRRCGNRVTAARGQRPSARGSDERP